MGSLTEVEHRSLTPLVVSTVGAKPLLAALTFSFIPLTPQECSDWSEGKRGWLVPDLTFYTPLGVASLQEARGSVQSALFPPQPPQSCWHDP